ncbi:MAG TPA: subclass B3 metallo-beta-lactamase [Gemmatimonadaceae bacterium]
MRQSAALALVVAALVPVPVVAQRPGTAAAGRPTAKCASCAQWNAPAAPRRLFGNTYYVGTRGLSAILLTSPAGHVLLDAGLPESAPLIMANIRALGFRVRDVKLILNSHAHFDHAGGIAAMQRASGADVAASPWSADVLRRGASIAGDPQKGEALDFPAVRRVREIHDGDTLRVGSTSVVAHFTGGHTPGGTTWTWRACEAAECLDFVYADSQTPVSAAGFEFTRDTTNSMALYDFQRGAAVLDRLGCDVLLTPHPDASHFWERVDARDGEDPSALRDPQGCRRLAATAREQLARRLASEDSAHMQPARADSELVALVVGAILRMDEVSNSLGDRIVDATARPWSIELPHTTAVWQAAAPRLLRALQGRARRPNDSREQFITVRQEARSDSLRAYDVEVGERLRCSGDWADWVEGSMTMEVRAAFREHRWQLTKAQLVGDAIPGLCR